MSQNFRSSFNEGGTNGSQLLTFANDAVERDENATRRGKIDIERWASETLARFVATFLLPVELLNSYLLLLTSYFRSCSVS